MTAASLRRRLDALERHPGYQLAGLAEALDAARVRCRTVAPEQRLAERTAKLMEFRAAAAADELTDLGLDLLAAMERLANRPVFP